MGRDLISLILPRYFINLAHRVRISISPIFSDENYDTGIRTTCSLYEIECKMREWGCEINHPNQYRYPNQVSSGHLYLKNEKQLHIRVTKVNSMEYELKGHVEWHGLRHPLLHTLCINLDYDKGYRMLKELWL